MEDDTSWAPVWLLLVGGAVLLFGVGVTVLAAQELLTATDYEAVGTVVDIHGDPDIRFTDDDGRSHIFRSEHDAKRVGEEVDVFYQGRDPAGTAATSADRNESWIAPLFSPLFVAAGAFTLRAGIRGWRQADWTMSGLWRSPNTPQGPT